MFLPYTNLPKSPDVFSKYTAPGTHIWVKPQNAKMIIIWIAGAGGGGKPAVGNGLGGGGGGGPGCLAKIMMPAFQVPDTLGFTIGLGGASGTAGGTSLILGGVARATLFTAGAGGSGAAALTGGTAGAAATTYWTDAGFHQAIAGNAGGASLTNGNCAFVVGYVLTGGGGGGTQDGFSGGITGVYSYPGVERQFLHGTTAIRGSNGYSVDDGIFFSLGGSGGGSGPGSTGIGGNGAMGSGGGGGGDFASGSGAIGGRGGDGFAYIWSI